MTEPGIYQITLGGRWSFEEFAEMPHFFNQVYAFHYAFLPGDTPRDRERLEHAFEAYPWQGGYSAVNFYHVLAGQIPRRLRPTVRKIKYASPGSIDLSLLAEAAQQIGTVVGVVVAAGLGVNKLYSEIHKEASKRKLLGIREQREHIRLRKEELDFVNDASVKLAKAVGFNSLKQLDELTHDPLATLKILMSYYRRVERLVEFEKNEKAHFPD